METQTKRPETLQDAILHFSNLETATQYVAKLRFPNGVCCVHCGALEPYYVKSRRIWKCRECAKQFSIKVGTIFTATIQMSDDKSAFDKFEELAKKLVRVPNPAQKKPPKPKPPKKRIPKKRRK